MRFSPRTRSLLAAAVVLALAGAVGWYVAGLVAAPQTRRMNGEPRKACRRTPRTAASAIPNGPATASRPGGRPADRMAADGDGGSNREHVFGERAQPAARDADTARRHLGAGGAAGGQGGGRSQAADPPQPAGGAGAGRRGAADHAMDLVALFEQQFCQVRTVLACDSGD